MKEIPFAVIGGSGGHAFLAGKLALRERLGPRQTPIGPSQPLFLVEGDRSQFLFLPRHGESGYEIAAPWVLSAFVDNAGIIDLDGENEVSFKVETHNHPSAIEPFGGANTGVGGVIRDVIGVSARPIAATDVLCFGPAEQGYDELLPGVLHPRRIASGVVAGIQDYGNKIGIPTVNGAILYDRGYTSNPLVFCGCAGIAPLDIVQAPAFKLLCLDTTEVIDALGEMNRVGALRFRMQGDVVELDVRGA